MLGWSSDRHVSLIRNYTVGGRSARVPTLRFEYIGSISIPAI